MSWLLDQQTPHQSLTKRRVRSQHHRWGSICTLTKPSKPGPSAWAECVQLATSTVWQRSANSFIALASLCVMAVLRLTLLPHSRSWSCGTQGLTWTEIAKKMGMTRSGAWSRYRKARPPKRRGWAAGSRFSPTRWTNILPPASGQPSLITSVAPLPERSSTPRDKQPTVSPPSVNARALRVPGADADDNAGDRNYLVHARPQRDHE